MNLRRQVDYYKKTVTEQRSALQSTKVELAELRSIKA